MVVLRSRLGEDTLLLGRGICSDLQALVVSVAHISISKALHTADLESMPVPLTTADSNRPFLYWTISAGNLEISSSRP